MNENVVKLYPSNAADNPDNVLEQAIGQYSSCIVIGWSNEEEPNLDVRSDTKMTCADAVFIVEKFKQILLSGAYGEQD